MYTFRRKKIIFIYFSLSKDSLDIKKTNYKKLINWNSQKFKTSILQKIPLRK